jgi:hypothetical protein
MAVSNALVQVCPHRQRRFSDDISGRIAYRFQTEHFAKLFQRNALSSDRDVLFRPTVQAKSKLASEPNIGRLLGNILQETLLRF